MRLLGHAIVCPKDTCHSNYSRRLHVRTGAKRTIGGGSVLALAAIAALAVPGAAFAVDIPATANVGLGGLTMTNSALAGFTATLAGVDQTVHTTQAFDVNDARGSGLGWYITLTSTTFTATGPTRTLPTTALTDGAGGSVAPVGVCDTGVTCTLADDSSLSPYIIAIPAAAVAPTAARIQNAAVNTGLGGQTLTHTMNLFLPGNTQAGAYASTWTYSLVSAP
jgi:hypothetical protein